MATAAEIRKKVRQAEQDRIKARSDAAIDVAAAHERYSSASAALRAAETELRRAIRAATTSQGYTINELAQVTDVSPSALRTATGDDRSTDSGPEHQGTD